MTRKGDKGDHPNDGQMTWTDTEGTWSGRGQGKTGLRGGGMPRPFTHSTTGHYARPMMTNEDDDDINDNNYVHSYR